MTQKSTSIATCTKGAVAIEYALIVALIAIALIGVMMTLGNTNKEILNTVSDNISEHTPS